jgi:hypothetical protein
MSRMVACERSVTLFLVIILIGIYFCSGSGTEYSYEAWDNG